ncbi:hypothetical protein ACFSC4_25580 [Deinococcus malanensis]|uniref:hypothetical protein n=1 Tax=Deinococcus malanensis TaxID=1706855 RepID=UPI0036280D22
MLPLCPIAWTTAVAPRLRAWTATAATCHSQNFITGEGPRLWALKYTDTRERTFLTGSMAHTYRRALTPRGFLITVLMHGGDHAIYGPEHALDELMPHSHPVLTIREALHLLHEHKRLLAMRPALQAISKACTCSASSEDSTSSNAWCGVSPFTSPAP